jgi:hypothetical protein
MFRLAAAASTKVFFFQKYTIFCVNFILNYYQYFYVQIHSADFFLISIPKFHISLKMIKDKGKQFKRSYFVAQILSRKIKFIKQNLI